MGTLRIYNVGLYAKRIIFSGVWIMAFFLILLNQGCNKEELAFPDVSNFNPIPPDSVLYNNLSPDQDVDYYSIRVAMNSDSSDILFQKGVKCDTAWSDSVCTAKVDKIPGEGFQYRSEDYWHYMVVRNSEKVHLYYTPRGVREFLGNINTREEAIFLAFAEDYRFDAQGDIETKGVRTIDNGYQVIATKMISRCNPTRIDRFLLEIRTNGRLLIIKQQPIYNQPSNCY